MHQKEFNEQMNSLSKISDQIIHINNHNDLNPHLDSLLDILIPFDLAKVNPLILNVLINNVCAKILTLFLGHPLSQSVHSLINFIISKNLLSPVYQSLSIQTKLTSNSPTTKPFSKINEPIHLSPSEDFSKIFDHNLERLLKIDSNTEKYINRNFGYSILDLSGQFIWCDEKSERVFETNSSGLFLKNIFDLMIPFSQHFLHQKFGSQLFGPTPQIGSAVTFSYVVYSKTSMTQFLKCLKRFGVHDARELKLRFENTHEENSVYHQYLRALSSRATIIPLKFTRDEFQRILDCRKYNIHVTDALFDLLNKVKFDLSDCSVDSKPQPAHLTQMLDDCLVTSPVCGKSSLKMEERRTEVKPSNYGPNNLWGQTTLNSEVIVMNAILLETRYASDFPRFEYSLMRNDPVIRGFEEKIIRKLTKENLTI